MYVNRQYSCVRQPERKKSSSVWHWSRWSPKLSWPSVGISLTFISSITFTLSCFTWSYRWLFSLLIWLSCAKFVVERPATPPAISDFNISSQPRHHHHHHHQSTSSHSAVPTVMLTTTSLIYVLLNGARSISFVALTYNNTSYLFQIYMMAAALMYFVYTYNFYFITGKQFRTDLLTLICCCYRSCSCSCSCSSSSSSSSSSSPAAAAAAAADANVRVARRGNTETVVWNFILLIWILKHITFISERHHQNSMNYFDTSSLKHQIIRHVSKLQITEFDD